MAKIILIEDDEFIREIYKRQLDRAELPTDAFPTGKDGIEALLKTEYDLLLLDIMLPDMTGLDVLMEVMKNAQIKTKSVVILTNLGQDNIIKECLTQGAMGYLIKAQYTPDQIVDETKLYLKQKNEA